MGTHANGKPLAGLMRAVISALLAVTLCAGLLPNAALAAEDSAGAGVAGSQASANASGQGGAALIQEQAASAPSIQYSTHVQKIGWQAWKKQGQMAGTTGKSYRLEGIKIRLANKPVSGSIQYRTHVQKIGWQGWKSEGQMSGTTGKGYRLEAIQLKLTGEMAKKYDVYYRVHAQKFGWMGWAKNGASAGTEGFGYRLEAIQINLVAKGAAAPGTTANAFAKVKTPVITYRTHVQSFGNQDWVENGASSGTTGKGKRLEGIWINVENKSFSGNVQYRTHVQKIGWQGWRNAGQMAGTSGKGYRLEAIQIRLTGDMANKYDVYYRVHAQKFGWMGWAKNGASAGTQGYGYRLEAIQVKLVKKNHAAPGSTKNAFSKAAPKPAPQPVRPSNPGPSAQPAPKPVTSVVYVSKTGSKYHRIPNCGSMRNPSAMSLSEAQSRGKSACKNCF